MGINFSKLKIGFKQSKKPFLIALRFDGAISPRFKAGRGISWNAYEPLIEKAFKVKKAKAIIMMINSPGGTPVQARLIVERIRALKAKTKKPVYAFCEDVAASGGYMLACAADKIYAYPDSLIGSIGVIGGGFGFPEIMKKIGVERRVYTAGKSKMKLDAFSPEKPEDIKWYKGILEDAHLSFIELVEQSRNKAFKSINLSKKEKEDLFSGNVWTGKQAKEIGLIDGIGDVYGVFKRKYKVEPQIKYLTTDKPPILQRLLGLSFSDAEAYLNDRILRSWYGF